MASGSGEDVVGALAPPSRFPEGTVWQRRSACGRMILSRAGNQLTKCTPLPGSTYFLNLGLLLLSFTGKRLQCYCLVQDLKGRLCGAARQGVFVAGGTPGLRTGNIPAGEPRVQGPLWAAAWLEGCCVAVGRGRGVLASQLRLLAPLSCR